MKKIFMIATVALAMIATACGGQKNQEAAEDEASDALTVDELLTNADQYVNQTVTVEGLCAHLCSHGGRKAFLQGNADNMLIRCEAFPGMDAPFSGETVHKPLKVTGTFVEERIDEDYLVNLERAEQERAYNINSEGGDVTAGEQQSGCDTERAATGQKDITTLNERIADYRARIAERQEKEGKPYLSFYRIDATGYEILPE